MKKDFIENDSLEATYDKTKPIVKPYVNESKNLEDLLRLNLPNSLSYDKITPNKLFEEKGWTHYRVNCFNYDYTEFGKVTRHPIVCHYIKLYTGSDKDLKNKIILVK